MRKRIEINPQYECMLDYIATLPKTFEKSGEMLYKGRNEVRAMTAPDGAEIVVKRFGRVSLLRRAIYSWIEKSKAQRAYDYGMRFREMGIDTPEPIACIEIYVCGLLSDAYFVSLRSDYKPLFGPLVEAEVFDRTLAENVASLMANLHSQGTMHGDPNLNNILYRKNDDGSVGLQLIDTNRSRFTSGKLSLSNCLKNLIRVSHRRDLLRYVTEQYARERGLDEEATVQTVMINLERFERNRRRRHRLKAIFSK